MFEISYSILSEVTQLQIEKIKKLQTKQLKARHSWACILIPHVLMGGKDKRTVACLRSACLYCEILFQNNQ